MARAWVLVSAATFFLPWTLFAQESPEIASDTNRRVAQVQRREWVRQQLVKLVPDPAQRAGISSRLDELGDDQVQIVVSLFLDELESRRRRQLKALRELNARERALQEERELAFQEQLRRQVVVPPGFYSPAIGYIPVVTWLPEGTSMTAQAVVSPDGRHVRMSVAPFFSSIGPIYTFNYMTGETKRFDP